MFVRRVRDEVRPEKESSCFSLGVIPVVFILRGYNRPMRNIVVGSYYLMSIGGNTNSQSERREPEEYKREKQSLLIIHWHWASHALESTPDSFFTHGEKGKTRL